jgi:predicted PurR-regulated permease PerM
METNSKIPWYAKITIITVGLVASAYILIWAELIIVPLLYAGLFAVLLTPFVSFLVARRIPPVIAITIVMLTALAIFSLVVYILVTQSQTVAATFPAFQQKLLVLSQNAIEWLALKLHLSTDQVHTWLINLRSQAIDNSAAYITQTFNTLGVVIATVVVIPVYVFMILYYQPLILEFVRELFSKEYHASVVEIMTQIRNIIQGYLRGLMLEMLIMAVLNSVALLAIGVEYAILLGIIAAVVNIIPYLGGIVGTFLPMVVALVNQDPLHMFLVLGAFSLIQFIDNHYLVPKVVASKVQVNALISIIGVLVGGALWGIPGMFLSIPFLAVLKIICDHIDSLKAWGYLLGDRMPATAVVDSFLKKGKVKK